VTPVPTIEMGAPRQMFLTRAWHQRKVFTETNGLSYITSTRGREIQLQRVSQAN